MANLDCWEETRVCLLEVWVLLYVGLRTPADICKKKNNRVLLVPPKLVNINTCSFLQHKVKQTVLAKKETTQLAHTPISWFCTGVLPCFKVPGRGFSNKRLSSQESSPLQPVSYLTLPHWYSSWSHSATFQASLALGLTPTGPESL